MTCFFMLRSVLTAAEEPGTASADMEFLRSSKPIYHLILQMIWEKQWLMQSVGILIGQRLFVEVGIGGMNDQTCMEGREGCHP
jgi:hypothetical protein